MSGAIVELKRLLLEIDDLDAAANLLEWDQCTYMPDGGAEARGRQLATLGRRKHQALTSVELKRSLDGAARAVDGLPEGDADRALVRVARRQFERAANVPLEFVGELRTHLSASYVAWTKARVDNDFAAVSPYLEKTVELSKRYADFFSGYDHPADVHIDESDEGITAEWVKGFFTELRSMLVPLIESVAKKPAPEDAFLFQRFPKEPQMELSRAIVSALGYDFSRGRLDLTHHPFMTRFSSGDVRITTRVNENDATDALYSSIHECGHALYEQGICRDFEGSPLGHGVSAGVHESQSRLWENLVGRSRPFASFLLPKLQERFPERLGDVTAEAFYRAINKVTPSLIRVDADEVTYNLHVMIRVELEMALLEGRLAVKDLPEAWNERYRSYLGVEVPDMRRGVMQDVHWYCTTIGGAFQGYTIGNVISAQVFETARRALPNLDEDIAAGRFAALRSWLVDHLYRHGSVHTPLDLVERVTGEPLGTAAFARYLRGKLTGLYGVEGSAAQSIALPR